LKSLKFYLATKGKCTPDWLGLNIDSNSITPNQTIDHENFSTITNSLDEYPSKNYESYYLASTTPPLVDDECDEVLYLGFKHVALQYTMDHRIIIIILMQLLLSHPKGNCLYQVTPVIQ